jgi:TRAP-type C4-dicarboxylate transport system permease large subunit
MVLFNETFKAYNSFILLAVPFFLLTANLMGIGGITDRLVKLSRTMVGSLPGALAQINVVLSVFFAGISGSATADDKRLPVVVRRTSGFVYYVSVAGVTGVKSADAADVAPAVARLRKASGLPVAVGFGIRTPEQAAAVARVADAAVVGSALVDEIESAAKLNENVTEKVLLKASELAKAVRSARLEMA